ncbi:MAG: bifunctional phosphopantothenoylcysteine decarboxylase/phosphopantothenate--cysteine ligase CoaBC [Desulfurococcales archaeon]|nr:bifunctional phosphopantothenoylcysteine decarboxylase/phosphopantothenate--cysteine ligase CoaBC [Desulfurococcales archaeon]
MGRPLLGHPSKSITGTVNDYLAGRCIILGLTGSVSLYKSIDAARWLMRRGAWIIPVMTRPAASLVDPMLLQWATGERPIVELTGEVEHIQLSKGCDAMLVAPATLSTMSKIAYGVADNPVALTAIAMRGEDKPVMIVPAMHQNMMDSPVYAEVVDRLTSMGYVVMPPRVEEGIAKYPDTWVVARTAAALASRGRDLVGERVLVTAGATREWIDPTRFLSNPSSGRMGIELAIEAWARGARVSLVYGHVEHVIPHMVEAHRVSTTEEMAKAVRELVSEGRFNYLIAAAAPADYRSKRRWGEKLRSGIKDLTLELEGTPKVIEGLAERVDVLVAFAAETARGVEDLYRAALDKMNKYGASIVVANNVGSSEAGFASEYLDALLLWKTNSTIAKEYIGRIDKEILSRTILDLAKNIKEGGL